MNPVTGRGRGMACLPRLMSEASNRDLNCEFRITEGPGHATVLAEEAAREGTAVVVAVGGDGTHSEVVQALVGSETSLGVVALGTGNDFARTLGVPVRDVGAALDIVKRGVTKWVDLGRDGERYFVSLLGVGFPAEVAAQAMRFRRLRGAAFSAGVYRSLHRMRAFPAELRMDGRLLELTATSILVQNTPFTGGGLAIAPGASLDDGFLDVIVVDDIGRLNLMWNFPKVYRGRHLAHPSFQAHRCRNVEIRSVERIRKTLDGEPFGVTPAIVSVFPRALRVFVPG